MENKLLMAALAYMKSGCSVIPVFTGVERKVPAKGFKVTPYRTQIADEAQIRRWWTKWPKANIAVITGKLSDVTVIDIDSDAGKDAVNEYLPDTVEMPVCNTPKGGQHLYFKYTSGIPNKARIIKGTDIRTEGGYILVPPSKNGKGNYAWIDGLSIFDRKPPPMPELLAEILRGTNPVQANSSEHYINKVRTNTNALSRGDNIDEGDNRRQQVTTSDNIGFTEGYRDNALFHLANCCIKGGMEPVSVEKYLKIIASNCTPPFPEKDIPAKIQSALNRQKNHDRNLTQEIRDIILTTSGNISTTFVYNRQQVTTREDKKKVAVILSRLEKEGLLEKTGRIAGEYHIIKAECDEISFLDAEVQTVDLWLPFNLHKMVQIMPGNIIVVAGEPNAGKTALLLNVIRSNMETWKTHYFSSEMGASELANRLKKFDDTPLTDWKFKAYERSQDFGAVIKPGEGNLNVVDFLELYDNFYEVSGRLSEIHNKLKGAIAIVALQKNPGQDAGLGGQRGLEKPRLYLAMGHGFLKVVKAKNWLKTENPNGKQVNFKIVDGCNFIQTHGWHVPSG